MVTNRQRVIHHLFCFALALVHHFRRNARLINRKDFRCHNIPIFIGQITRPIINYPKNGILIACKRLTIRLNADQLRVLGIHPKRTPNGTLSFSVIIAIELVSDVAALTITGKTTCFTFKTNTQI